MKKTFLFYDLETSDLHPAFGQIIQFSAIRTDLQLNELERYEWIIRPNPDIIPSPTAMLIHRTPIARWEQGEPELTVVKRIHALFNTPGTISLGYNTLGFDDEFLRFSFYRNLLPCYTHQYANACFRADLYPITTLYYLFYPQVLQWPIINDRVSLKLEKLNASNHLARGAAHTAIVDIEATIALAKKFMEYPSMWTYALGYFDKEKESQRIQKLPLLLEKKYALLIDGVLGVEQNFCAPILNLGHHYHYKNQTCWLRLDTQNLSLSTENDYIQHAWVINKKPVEPGFLLPPSEKYLDKLSEEKKILLKKNIDWLEKNPKVFSAIKEHYCHFTYPKYSHIAPESSLYYQGFWSHEEQILAQKFHAAAYAKKKSLIDGMSHPLLKTLAIYAVGRLDIRLLSDEQRQFLENDWQYRKKYPEKIIDYKGKKKLSLEQAFKEIQELHDNALLDEEQRSLLHELKNWLERRNS